MDQAVGACLMDQKPVTPEDLDTCIERMQTASEIQDRMPRQVVLQIPKFKASLNNAEYKSVTCCCIFHFPSFSDF